MPADTKKLNHLSDNGEKHEHTLSSTLIRAIQMEMEKMTPKQLERLYGVISVIEKKKTKKNK